LRGEKLPRAGAQYFPVVLHGITDEAGFAGEAGK
jgi:hypothetical protein